MPAARRAVRRTGRRTARRTSRRMAAADSSYEQQDYEPAPTPAAPEPAPAPTAQDEDDAMIQRIKELGELHDQGVLTDDQFEEAKKRLID